MSRQRAAAVGEPAPTLIQQQLERLLASATFRQVDRLKRFLSFIVLDSPSVNRKEVAWDLYRPDFWTRGANSPAT